MNDSDPRDLEPADERTVFAQGTFRAVSLVALAIALIYFGLVAYQAGRIDRFTEAFEDFDTALLQITITALRIGFPGFLTMSVASSIILIAKELVLKDKSIALVINTAGAGVALVTYAFLSEAIVTPMFTLIQSISK